MSTPSTLPSALMPVLAEYSERAEKLSTIMCRLVTDGAALGELEEVTRFAFGEARVVRTIPQQWLQRLAVAVERGALERMPVDRIVERLMSPPVSP
jgi:hypothetical protein